uniref:Voltage-dependent anion-selective channel protein 3 n=1 Tax=Syphacia muris TaxID=451379 RepID=A0A0N5AG28_9BILA
MAPPSFNDLWKPTRDLFDKGFNCGLLNVETTATSRGSEPLEIKTSFSHGIENEKSNGNVNLKYKIPSLGVTVTEKWSTANVLSTVLEVTDQFAKELKIIFDTTYSLKTHERLQMVKGEWRKSNVSVTPILDASIVGEHCGWMVGLGAGVDITKNMLTKLAFGFAKYGPDYSLFSYTKDGKDFGFHYNSKILLVSKMEWTVGTQSTRFVLGAKYCPTRDLALKAKVNEQSDVSLCGTHSFSDQPCLLFKLSKGLFYALP